MDKRITNLKKLIIEFVTFVNLPIKRKFLVFSLGVFFWFFVLFAVSVSTLVVIRYKSNTIVHDLIPRDKTTQKIARDLLLVGRAASDMMRLTEAGEMARRTEQTRARFGTLKMYLEVLSSGGQIQDYDRASNSFLERYAVSPLAGDPEGVQYVKTVTNLVNASERKFAEYAAARTAAMSGRGGNGPLEDRLKELNGLLDEALLTSTRYSTVIAQAYERHSSDIGSDFLCTTATVIVAMVIASVLLVIFTHWLSKSVVIPISSISAQIRSLGEGDINSMRKIEITTMDEIGVLSSEFNTLMESIARLASFKKLIEEDGALEDVYLRLAHKFKHDFSIGEFTIYEIANSRNKMKAVYPLEVANDDLFCNADILDDCMLCRAKKTGHEVSSFAHPDMCKSFLTHHDKEYICVPLIMGGVAGGVVQFVFDRKPDNVVYRKTIEHMVFKAKQYITESVSVIDAKRLMSTLKDSALKDSLTGLYNRRFLQEYTETLVSGVLRRGKHVGLIMCDIDYFKQVNDVHGHTAGDAILKETSVIIKDSIRASDFVIRFGGEEFLVVLLDIKSGDTMMIAEKIRESMANTKFKVPDGIITKTISLGMSEFPEDAETFWQSIKYADVALYRAKDTGRNRSVRFTSDMWKENQI